MIEKLLGTFDGAEEQTRVELVQVTREAGARPELELRMQRECGELGWTTQRRVALAAGQWEALRDALNLVDRDVREDRSPSHHEVERRAHLRLIG